MAQVEVARTGRHLFRFRYRVGSKHQADEALEVFIGRRRFAFRDEDLKNTNRWEWSPELEVSLASGLQRIELRSIGRHRVHLENIRLRLACECGR